MSNKRFLPKTVNWFRLPEYVRAIFEAEPDNSAELLLAFDAEGDFVTVDKSTLGGGGGVTQTSQLINDGADGTSTYVENDEIGTVATSNDYNDLDNLPILGTAAATAITDYATAAQGALADSAIQPADLATVATSGDYLDLINLPTIPTVGQGLTDNAGVIDFGGTVEIGSVGDPDELDLLFNFTQWNILLNSESGLSIADDVGTDIYLQIDPVTDATVQAPASTIALIDAGDAKTLTTKEWVQSQGGGGGNTIYSADDSLAGARTVTMAANQLTWSGTGGDIIMNSGRLGVQQQVFGGSRLGDSELQVGSIDVQSINFKDAGQLTAFAMFFSAVGGGDGYVTTMKNFVDDVNVISVSGIGTATAFGAASREVESTVGLRNDFSGGEFRVFDFFNNDYDSATPVSEAQGFVAIHGGGATAKKVGIYRYDTITYTPIFETGATDNVVTFTEAPKQPDGVAADDSATVGQIPTISSGTFTPTLVDLGSAATITRTINSATYERIGDMIFFNIFLTSVDSDVALTGDLMLSGMPFSADAVYLFNALVQTASGATLSSERAIIVGTNVFFTEPLESSNVGATLNFNTTGVIRVTGSYRTT